eukprot:COSAG05_NODE_22286_length_266_cov_0.526946_1_plen_29_part_10
MKGSSENMKRLSGCNSDSLVSMMDSLAVQ